MSDIFQHHPLHWYFEQMTTINKGSSMCPGDQRETNTQTFQGDYGFNQLWIENIHTQNPICMEYVQIFFSFPKGCKCLHIPFAWHWVSRQFLRWLKLNGKLCIGSTWMQCCIKDLHILKFWYLCRIMECILHGYWGEVVKALWKVSYMFKSCSLSWGLFIIRSHICPTLEKHFSFINCSVVGRERVQYPNKMPCMLHTDSFAHGLHNALIYCECLPSLLYLTQVCKILFYPHHSIAVRVCKMNCVKHRVCCCVCIRCSVCFYWWGVHFLVTFYLWSGWLIQKLIMNLGEWTP